MLGQIRMVCKWGLCRALGCFSLCTHAEEVLEAIRRTNGRFFFLSAVSSVQRRTGVLCLCDCLDVQEALNCKFCAKFFQLYHKVKAWIYV